MNNEEIMKSDIVVEFEKNVFTLNYKEQHIVYPINKMFNLYNLLKETCEHLEEGGILTDSNGTPVKME